MAAKKSAKKFAGTIEKVDEGAIEILKLHLSLTEADRKAIAANPAQYIKKFLLAQGQVVNGLSSDEGFQAQLLKDIKKMKGPGAHQVDVIVAHVTKPPEHKSKHIIIRTV